MNKVSLLFCLVVGIGTTYGKDSLSCRFLSLEGTTPLPVLATSGEKGEAINITVPAASLSQPFICQSKGNTLSFHSSTDRLLISTAAVPSKMNSAILVFTPSPNDEGKSPWQTAVLDDSPKTFEDGGARIANLFSKDIRFIIGNETILLKPGESRSIGMPKERDDFNMATLVAQFQKGEAWVNINETMLRFLPGARYIMIAHPDSNFENPRLFLTQETKPAVPAKR